MHIYIFAYYVKLHDFHEVRYFVFLGLTPRKKIHTHTHNKIKRNKSITSKTGFDQKRITTPFKLNFID